MDIKDGDFYSINASVKITQVSKRTLQRIAKENNVRRIDRRYLFSGADLKKIIKEREQAPKEGAPAPKGITQAPTKNKTGATLNIADLQNLKLDEIEDFEFKFKRPGEFPKEGSFVFIPSEYDFAEYRPGEYADAEEKLQEWQHQKQALIEQKTDFERLIKSQREQKEFYKGQLEYYQKLADRTLDMHEKLLETIQTQTKDHFIQTTITAKNTEWKKGTEPDKK
tara:strand:- start:63 stop:734 length:672 start_codon:yes stop_codon:yes gene_type:complete